MFRRLTVHPIAWLAIGLLSGLILSGLILSGSWPESPLHAVATDRCETFAMATGPVDEDFEAVYFLDYLTGDLTAVVLAKQGMGFSAFYRYNVLTDLNVDPSKNPRYMMTTGMVNRRRGASQMQPSLSAVYVAEVTTGQVVAYGIPWSRAAHATGRPVGPTPLVPLGMTRFRAAAAGAAIPTP